MRSGICPDGWDDSKSPVPSPHVALFAREDLVMVRAPISEPGRYYDDTRTIVLRQGLLLERERQVLWHELTHADRGDEDGHTDLAVERLVERLAAERAMPWSSIEWAWRTAVDMSEMAGLLRLPEEWVHFRIKHLEPERKSMLRVA